MLLGTFTFLLSLAFGTAHAQRVLGVAWELPGDDARAVRQLQQFRELGITVLELRQTPSDRLWSEINRHNLTVYADLHILFPITHTFAGSDSALYRQSRKKIRAFAAQPSVKALNLFTYGAIHRDSFKESAASFFKHFHALRSIRAIYTDNRTKHRLNAPFDFFRYDIRLSPKNIPSPSIPGSPDIDSYRYHPSPELRERFVPFKQAIQQTAAYPRKPFFMESSWLLSMVEKYPELATILPSLSSESDPVFPAPAESLPSPNPSPLPILTLLLVWAMLALHYNMSPLYRKSLFRYFTGHKFFLNDIFRQHIRSPFPSFVIIIQNALLISAALFITFTRFWSDTGLQSLQHHFPGLFFFTGGVYDIFLAAFGITLIFSVISILWLYFSHKSLRSITQIMTLFAWPMQINIALGTLAIAMHVAGGSANDMIIALLTGLMLAVCLGSFIITSLDAAQSLSRKRLQYISSTAGLYLLVLGALALWLMKFNDPFWQVIGLSLHLK